MTGNRFIRRRIGADLEPKLGRMFLASLGMHLLVFLFVSGIILPHFGRDRPPVYYVDLVNLPVADPQAGRPDARPKTSKKAAKKTSAPVQKKTVTKSTPTRAKVEKPAASDTDVAARIASMREKQQRREEIDSLKDKLAALARNDTRGEDASPDAPVGVADGSGEEVGVSWQLWLQAYLKEQWALSKYQVTRLDLEAEVRIVYNERGQMESFDFLRKSGDRLFDESVRNAVLKSRELPKEPPVPRWQVDVVFNLKNLLDK